MKKIIRQINLHLYKEDMFEKVSFLTAYDEATRQKEYSIAYPSHTVIVSKEEGNRIYKELRRLNPRSKALIILDS